MAGLDLDRQVAAVEEWDGESLLLSWISFNSINHLVEPDNLCRTDESVVLFLPDFMAFLLGKGVASSRDSGPLSEVMRSITVDPLIWAATWALSAWEMSAMAATETC